MATGTRKTNAFFTDKLAIDSCQKKKKKLAIDMYVGRARNRVPIGPPE